LMSTFVSSFVVNELAPEHEKGPLFGLITDTCTPARTYAERERDADTHIHIAWVYIVFLTYKNMCRQVERVAGRIWWGR